MAHVHRARNPDRWFPRRAPRSSQGLVVDRGHPLAAGLVGFWLLADPYPPHGTRNLVSGAPLPSNSNTGTPILTHEGVVFRNSAAGGLLASATENFGASNLLGFTIAGRIRCLTGSAVHGVAAARAGATVRNSLQVTTNNMPRYAAAYGVTVNLNGNPAFTGSNFMTLCGTTRSATDHELYVDGATSTTSTTSAGTTPGQRNTVIVGQTTGGNGRANTEFLWLAFWARGFSAAEAALLHADPYSLLVPAG